MSSHGLANVYLPSALTLAMLLGLRQAFRTGRETALPYLFVVLFHPLVFYIAHPAIRYRHVTDPKVTIPAGLGVRFLFSASKTSAQGASGTALPSDSEILDKKKAADVVSRCVSNLYPSHKNVPSTSVLLTQPASVRRSTR